MKIRIVATNGSISKYLKVLATKKNWQYNSHIDDYMFQNEGSFDIETIQELDTLAIELGHKIVFSNHGGATLEIYDSYME